MRNTTPVDELGQKPATTILLSSLFTLFTTLWCCIRPDLPSHQDSKLRILLTKLNIIFWALLWPEAVLFWAVRQWIVAGKVAGVFQHRGWTRRHGLFLLMGGFVLCNNNGQPTKTLSFFHFDRLLHQNAIDPPHLSASEIQERSNLHPVFVLIALLQAIWFIAQCLSRFINFKRGQGLPVTQLEAMTTTLVISYWCMFIFAWKKPLDARSPILIRPTRLNLSTVYNTQPDTNGDFERETNLLGSQIRENITQLECPQLRSASAFKFLSGLWPTCRSLLLWPFRSICKDVYHLRMGIEAGYDVEFPDGTLKIPLFFVSHMQDLMVKHRIESSLPPIALLGMGISAASLLFVLRSSSTLYFPSEDVQLVWQIASIVTMSFSTVTFGFFTLVFYFSCFVSQLDDLDNENLLCCLLAFMIGALCIIFSITILVGFVPFLLARLVLLVTSTVCLMSLPADVLVGRSWTDYIPHFS